MSDELLSYYHRELSYIRKMAVQFAEKNPQIAERLRIGSDGVTKDPHIGRLIEGFAYLTARVRRKLDDDFPELTDALLGVLYPHYLAPVPSMTTVQLRLDRGQGDLVAGYPVKRGEMIQTEPVDGEACLFRTGYPVTLWPIEVTTAALRALPFSQASAQRPANAVATLKIELRCYSQEITFSKVVMPAFRFHVAGQDQHVFAMYELIMNNTLQVNITSGGNDQKPLILGRSSLKPVGFEREEGLLPLPGRSSPGYRLLSEYFAFPRKFLYFDLADFPEPGFDGKGNRIELTFFLDRTLPDLEPNVNGDMFRLGCTPAINLFSKDAEPLRLTQTSTQVRIIPDARAGPAHEVYSVDKVMAAAPDGARVEFLPFYAPRHGRPTASEERYWMSTRRPASGVDKEMDTGTEVDLSLVDLNFERVTAANWTLYVQTTCTNRDLPARLPFGGGQPRMQLVDRGSVGVECLSQPTAALRPAMGRGSMWRLISHLNLNHLSISTGPEADQANDGHNGGGALREILKLYDITDSSDTRSKIDGIISVSHTRVVARAGGVAAGGFCRGIQVRLRLDDSRFSDRGSYLFASVLERFLGLYCSINSFSKLVVNSKQREGDWCEWAPRAGQQVLL